MKKRKLVLGSLLLGLLITSCDSSKKSANNSTSAAEPAVRSISILHTNDMHGSYMPFTTTTDNATAQTGDSIDNLVRFDRAEEIGGFAWLAGAIKSVREKRGEDMVILLDGGDTFSDDQLGNLTKGEAMIKLMNLVDYDLMALGNHDFDYGLEQTRNLEQLANFPMRAANIKEEDTNKPIFGEAYVIIEKQGLKIGLLPLSYRNTPLTGNPANIKGLRFETGINAIREQLPKLEEEADLIVVLSHEGMAVDKLIAEEVEGVDLIVGAHSHDVIYPPMKIKDTYIVQALSDASVLGETTVSLEEGKISNVEANYHYLWHDEVEPDPEVKELISQLRSEYRSKLEEKVTVADTIIGRQYKSESPFDKVVNNLMRENYDTEVAFMPGVGYGISLQDEVKSEDVYKLLPHPAKIITLELSGEQIKATLEQSAANINPKDKLKTVGGLIQTSGISYELDFTKPIGQRISDLKVNGQEIEPSRSYTVATHSGMLNGIHNYTEFKKGKNLEKTGKPLNEFIVEQLKKNEVLSFPENMGEVMIVQ
ncbi:bifunctional UDP-sugar hydrolase/5'-nucleotidase [Salinimicrobium catena]|uniref:bifunctional metallophosphatase/5'-nucleotidase n=1 Tax=Salinimicrobium catena TaxID=390640 RepID=UPI002FE4511E